MTGIPLSAAYAIRALTCIARCDCQWYTAREIAECASIPLDFLRKVLAGLERAGLLVSKAGYRGGYRLTRDPSQIMLLEIVAAIEPKVLEPTCFLSFEECSESSPCVAHELWSELQKRVERFLAETDLEMVAGHEWSPSLLGPEGGVRSTHSRRVVSAAVDGPPTTGEKGAR